MTGSRTNSGRAGLVPVDRRVFLALSGIAALTALQGCMSVLDIGESGVDAASGKAHLGRIRSSHGLPPLAADPRLERAALEQSGFMARSGRMTHDTGFRRDFATRMKRNGIGGAAAENLAHGAFGPDRMFEMWMSSPGHRRNMLNPGFGRFGLAYTQEAGGKRRYWTLVLGR